MAIFPVQIERAQPWSDWLGFQTLATSIIRPRNRESLVAWLEAQDLRNISLRGVGSGHSTSAVARPDNPNAISVRVEDLEIDPEEEREAVQWLDQSTAGSGFSFVRLPAGMSISRVNDYLAARGLAMPNLGSFDEQTLIGAISTGTHGSGFGTGPLCDLVSSIEIVTCVSLEGFSRVKAFRIEPKSGPTIATEYNGNKFGLELIKDDNTFYSCVVGLGCFGIVTAVTLRVSTQFWLKEERSLVSWNELRRSDFLAQAIAQNESVDFIMTPLPKRALFSEHYFMMTTRSRVDPGSSPGPIRNDLRRIALVDALNDPSKGGGTRSGLTSYLAKKVSKNPKIANFQLINTLESEVENDRQFGGFSSESYRVFRTSIGDLVYATSAEIAVDYDDTLGAIALCIQHLADLQSRGYHHGSPLGIRFVGASQHFLSPAYGRRTCTIEAPILRGATRRRDSFSSETDTALMLSEFLQKFSVDSGVPGRPHWGQRNWLSRADAQRLYPRFNRWEKYMREFNRFGIFDNRFSFSISPLT